MKQRRSGLGPKSLALLEQVKAVTDELRSFWPLTLRQLFYQLVSRLVIENSLGNYKALSELLTKARLAGLVPWEALEDRSRTMHTGGGWEDRRRFVGAQLDQFLKYYSRDLQQGQPAALEVWIEKDALSRIVSEVAGDYCVTVVVAKGFSSVSFVHECRQRIEEQAKMNKPTKILYFGDLDPSGWEMLPAMLQTLQVEMGLGDRVQGIRCALTPAQAVDRFRLPRSIDAIKAKDTRTPKYQAMLRAAGYPADLAVELDALSPAILQGLVREAIEGQLDKPAFERQKQLEQEDLAALERLRADVIGLIKERFPAGPR